MADNANDSQRPAVGDLGYYQSGQTRELCIVTGHNPDGSVSVHVFGLSYRDVNKDSFVPFSVDDDGGIPSAPEPETPTPAPAPERW